MVREMEPLPVVPLGLRYWLILAYALQTLQRASRLEYSLNVWTSTSNSMTEDGRGRWNQARKQIMAIRRSTWSILRLYTCPKLTHLLYKHGCVITVIATGTAICSWCLRTCSKFQLEVGLRQCALPNKKIQSNLNLIKYLQKTTPTRPKVFELLAFTLGSFLLKMERERAWEGVYSGKGYQR